MSIVTCELLAQRVRPRLKSQLPFGFDVDCYFLDLSVLLKVVLTSLNCLSALMSIVTRTDAFDCSMSSQMSQLPFGFDVDCYLVLLKQITWRR